MATSAIGEYLRARREQVRPEDVGIEPSSRRRVPGLRRDELAMLAGISTEYYTRLEQGRDRHPSAQVLDAVARVLDLDEPARTHLHLLADPARRPRRAPRRTERVRPSVAALVDAWPAPAYVEGRYLDVLHANATAIALTPMLHPGANLLRSALLDEQVQAAVDVSERAVSGLIGRIRAAAGTDVDDPRLTDLVGELTLKSPLFRRLWDRHDVGVPPSHGRLAVDSPLVGPLELLFDKFAVVGAEGQVLVMYQVEPGTRSAEALTLLAAAATPAATTPTAGRDRPGAPGRPGVPDRSPSRTTADPADAPQSR
ncbi:MAG TPA: helix-turn-helix transcriptional regulator [Cellulomonas sp.]